MKWALYALIIFFVLAYFIFRLPSVQTAVAQKLADFISKKTGTEIRIGSVKLSEFIKIEINDISARDHHDSTFTKVNSILIEILPAYLLNDELYFKDIQIDSAFIALIEYKNEGELNLMKLIKPFMLENPSDTTENELAISIENIVINNSTFVLDMQNEEHYDGMDYVHLFVDSINVRVTDFKIETDSLIGNIEYLSAREKCGFNLKSFQGQAIVSPRGIDIPDFYFQANNSYAFARFRLEYNHWSDWLEFVDNVRFNSVVDSSMIFIDDIKYFSTELSGMKNMISASGILKGSIANIRLKKASLFHGDNTMFNGDISMTGLPDFEQTFIRLKAKSAKISHDDLSNFLLPEGETLEIPQDIDKLGVINIKGRFTGFYYDFVSNARFNTALGSLSTDISLQPNNSQNDFTYSGKIITNNFDLGKLLNNNYIGMVTMDAGIDGTGLSSTLNAEYVINFNSIEIGGYTYDNSKIEGNILDKRISAELATNNVNFSITAKGYFDFADSLPHLVLNTRINNSRVNRLFMIDSDTLGTLSAIVYLDIIGDDLDNMQGWLHTDSVKYSYNNLVYFADSVILSSYIIDSLREIDFHSPYLIAKIDGFTRLSNFPSMYSLVFHNILPNLIDSKTIINDNPLVLTQRQKKLDRGLSFDFKFLDTKSISDIFYPDFHMSSGSSLVGSYNFSGDSLSLNIESQSMNFMGFIADDVAFSLNKNSEAMYYNLNAGYLETAKAIAFDSIGLNGYLHMDTAEFNLVWGGIANNNRGVLEGRMEWDDVDIFHIDISKGEFYLNDSIWKIKPDARIDIANHFIKVSDFELYEENNSLFVNGQISDNTHDALRLRFNNFDISLFDFYTKRWSTNFDGIITGELELSSVWNHFGFISNFTIQDFKLNNVDLHTVKMNTLYSRSREAVVFDMVMLSDNEFTKFVDLGGFMYPNRDENQLDIELRIDSFPLKSIESYLSSFSSEVSGTAKGKIRIKGNLDKPIFLGTLKTDIDDILIDYTNVHYSINDKLIFTPNYFGFINAKAKDIEGNELALTVKLTHDFFSDINLHIDVKPNNAQLLNTNSDDNELFYGKANGVGSFNLDGNFDELSLKLDIKPTGDSYISIPVSSQSSAEVSDFITFVVKDSSVLLSEALMKDENALKFDMDVKLDITPTTLIELVMDEKAGDIIAARGNGKMRLVYDKDENFNMFGKYIIDRGNYLFTLQGLVKKRFVIESGSEIVWDGDINNTKINLKAAYLTDAKLWDLLQSIDSSAVYKKPSKVYCIIEITGDLYNPQLKFDIELPDESIATREMVARMLSVEATGNSEEMNKNFVSLLVLGRFQPPSGYDAGENPNALLNTGTEVLAEQMGNLLNQFSDDVEIGVAWSPGDDVTTQEIAVALSYSMLDDRLLLDGKFGTGGGSTNTDEAQRIIGDFNAEYKLTEDGRIRAKVFNRTNYNDPLSKKAPYTQGVGIAFRKDFSNFKELFSSKKKRQLQEQNNANEENKITQ